LLSYWHFYCSDQLTVAVGPSRRVRTKRNYVHKENQSLTVDATGFYTLNNNKKRNRSTNKVLVDKLSYKRRLLLAQECPSRATSIARAYRSHGSSWRKVL
jgi:hypothetical protein